MVLPLSRLHGLRGERKALMAASHLCLERGLNQSSNVVMKSERVRMNSKISSLYGLNTNLIAQ